MVFLVFNFKSKDPQIIPKLAKPWMRALLTIYSFILPGFLAYGISKTLLYGENYYLLYGVFMLVLNLLLKLKGISVNLFRLPLWVFSFIVMALQFI